MPVTGQKENKNCVTAFFCHSCCPLPGHLHPLMGPFQCLTCFPNLRNACFQMKILTEHVSVHYLWDLQILGREGNKSFLYLLQKQFSSEPGKFAEVWRFFRKWQRQVMPFLCWCGTEVFQVLFLSCCSQVSHEPPRLCQTRAALCSV